MASVQTSSYDGRYLKLTVTEESYSIDDNTSTIKWLLESIGGNSNYYNVYSCEVKINNVTQYGPTTKTWDSKVFPAAKGSTSGTVVIQHNADGTASPVAFSLRGAVFNNNPQTYSDSLTLTTIPRASSITVTDANIGSSTNITINKASPSFTTTLYYKASGQSSWTKIVDKTSNQVYGWTVSTSFYSLIPNSKTISCQFKAETYSGSTLIGEKTTNATFTATGDPIINSATIESIDNTTINLVGSNRMIRYISTIQVTVNASGANSASISQIKVNNVIASNGIATFLNASTYSYNVTVTDSRGYTTTRTFAITWTDYIPLTLNATIVRNQPTDGIINISYNGNYFNSSFRTSSDTYINNTLTVQYRYRVKNGSWGSWTSLSPTKIENTYSQSNYQISGFNYQNQYEFQIRAIDKVVTRTIEGINVSKGQPVYWWDEDGLYVNGLLKINDTLIIESGSNANGNYVKYNDGTLIQYNNTTVNDQAISNQYGNTGLYTGTRTVTFPISFLDTNYMAICGEFKWGTGASWGIISSRNNKNWMTIMALDFISRDAGTNTDVSWIAVGKWK